MAMRTHNKTVTFVRPFTLGDVDDIYPAGAYQVETDEERVEALSFPVYRRVRARIHLHAEPSRPGIERILTTDPEELDEALKRDRGPLESPEG